MTLSEKFTGYVSNLMEPIKTAYADIGADGKWFCNPARPDFEKADYSSVIYNFNQFSDNYLRSNSGATMTEKGDYLIGNGLDEIGKRAACLKEVHGINPDSVAEFSPETQEVFIANIDKLIETSPTLVNYAKVPEIGNHLNEIIGSVQSYLSVASVPVQEKAAEASATGGDLGFILALGIVGIAAVTYGVKKLSASNLFE